MTATPSSDAPDLGYSGHSYSGKELLDAELPAAPYPLARAWVDAALARSQSEPDVFEPLACSPHRWNCWADWPSGSRESSRRHKPEGSAPHRLEATHRKTYRKAGCHADFTYH